MTERHSRLRRFLDGGNRISRVQLWGLWLLAAALLVWVVLRD
jgi:hypothetical protein